MRMIISPAKTMNMTNDHFEPQQMPIFLKETEILLEELREKDDEALQAIWKCSDKIAALNRERIRRMDLHHSLTPAILAFEGIQYKYMAPIVFENKDFEYIEKHLRILSGFYGCLRPFDGVRPYRLEMQAKLKGKKVDSLYAFWGRKIADQLFSESHCILNLASEEYSKCISPYMTEEITFITCIFGEIKEGKVIEKGTLVKMARGEMVRFMAEHKIEEVEEIKAFNRLGYAFSEKHSDHRTFVFLKDQP
ncbi:hypothetical protein SAMN05192551_1038 [Tindallia magadiensis]|uniref:UPF0246 protein SAMN05192551_1038 n=1 Tax=Tindallia magadiensis TaxID=69895 RepID=A0A1I3CSX7_9FIRM|nr:peroxide stress protein YaaA [Tindallia magadiensis]SFH77644.1 hypothetical protein SAMN05192551_1038 [Tindallia magadiensis]